jgi:hypothetical protein
VDDPTVDNPTGQSDSVDNPTEIPVWGKKEGIRSENLAYFLFLVLVSLIIHKWIEIGAFTLLKMY